MWYWFIHVLLIYLDVTKHIENYTNKAEAIHNLISRLHYWNYESSHTPLFVFSLFVMLPLKHRERITTLPHGHIVKFSKFPFLESCICVRSRR